MKVLLIVFFLCVQTCYCINTCFDFGKDRINLGVLQNTTERKCATNGNDKHLSQVINNFSNCISNSTRTNSHNLETNKGFCNFLQEGQFKICLEMFTTELSPCLSENEIYIQQHLLDAYDALYEELCGINGVSNFEYLHDETRGAAECIQTCGVLFVKYGLCTGNLNIFKQLDKGVLNLNKQDVCRDLKSFHTCSTDVLDGICNQEYSRFTDLVLHPLLVGCNDFNARK